jgi:glucosamine-6-phosphate deaminase
VARDAGELAERAAQRLLAAVDRDRDAVLGLPTGTTPLGMYRHVVAACRLQPRCFAGVTTFNLDEYVGLRPAHPSSYRSYMERHLFAHVDLDRSRAHLPDGTAAAVRRECPALSLDEALAVECLRYEKAITAAGGLSLTVLGLGVNGHIAFNEPGSCFGSRTRVVDLAAATRRANAPHFPGEHVPRQAITLGIGTILESRSILLLASGAGKAEAVARLRSGRAGEELPGSALHRHGDVTVLVDGAAAAGGGRWGRVRQRVRSGVGGGMRRLARG